MGKKAWLAGLLNFLLLGLGTLYNGKRKFQGIMMTIGAVMLTYLEQVRIKAEAPDLFILFSVSVLIIAVACAYDGYQEAKSI